MTYVPGDFILVETHDFWSNLIHLGQRLRFRGNDHKYTRWNHAALIVSPTGNLIEAQSSGVHTSHINNYSPEEYTVVHVAMNDEDREEAVVFARSCINEGYGWLTIASIVLSLLTGLKFSFGYDGHEICSGLVARSLERGPAIFPRDASHMTPADLAKYYSVEQNPK